MLPLLFFVIAPLSASSIERGEIYIDQKIYDMQAQIGVKDYMYAIEIRNETHRPICFLAGDLVGSGKFDPSRLRIEKDGKSVAELDPDAPLNSNFALVVVYPRVKYFGSIRVGQHFDITYGDYYNLEYHISIIDCLAFFRYGLGRSDKYVLQMRKFSDSFGRAAERDRN